MKGSTVSSNTSAHPSTGSAVSGYSPQFDLHAFVDSMDDPQAFLDDMANSLYDTPTLEAYDAWANNLNGAADYTLTNGVRVWGRPGKNPYRGVDLGTVRTLLNNKARLPLSGEIVARFGTLNNWLITGGQDVDVWFPVDMAFDGLWFSYGEEDFPLRGDNPGSPAPTNPTYSFKHRIDLLEKFGGLLVAAGVTGALTVQQVRDLCFEDPTLYVSLFHRHNSEPFSGWVFLPEDLAGDDVLLGSTEVTILEAWATTA